MRTPATLSAAGAALVATLPLIRGGSVAAGPERLSTDNLNPSVVAAAYAVRGPVLDRALELVKQLEEQPGSLPFDEVVQCNIGNPQALGQLPLSFHRQVLSLTLNPALLAEPDDAAQGATGLFEADVLARASAYTSAVPSMGAYTHSQGIAVVRKEVAGFIADRDGVAPESVDPEALFLTNGASDGVRMLMQTLLRRGAGVKDGVLVPIPQYPLYSATCTLLDGELVPYYLDEADGWGLGVAELEAQLKAARQAGTTVRGLVVINPGNPTGQTLTEANMRAVVAFCAKEGLVLIADEVYQENIWRPDRPFVSFRKVAVDMGYSAKAGGGGTDEQLELVSFHSISKGFLGECGLRGGYFELFGIADEVKAQLYKLASISLCSNTAGQVMTGLMVAPPQPGDPSHGRYETERKAILASLESRARKVAAALDALPGIHCRPSDGALYAFPRIDLPPAFVQHAEAKSMQADELFCLALLEATGVVVVPGSGFGQAEGTWHFRTTFLPPEAKIDGVLARIAAFHTAFVAKWSAAPEAKGEL